MAFVASVGGSFTSLALTWDISVYEAFHWHGIFTLIAVQLA